MGADPEQGRPVLDEAPGVEGMSWPARRLVVRLRTQEMGRREKNSLCWPLRHYNTAHWGIRLTGQHCPVRAMYRFGGKT